MRGTPSNPMRDLVLFLICLAVPGTPAAPSTCFGVVLPAQHAAALAALSSAVMPQPMYG